MGGWEGRTITWGGWTAMGRRRMRMRVRSVVRGCVVVLEVGRVVGMGRRGGRKNAEGGGGERATFVWELVGARTGMSALEEAAFVAELCIPEQSAAKNNKKGKRRKSDAPLFRGSDWTASRWRCRWWNN